MTGTFPSGDTQISLQGYRLTGATGSAGFGGTYSETYIYDDLGRMDRKTGNTLNVAADCNGNAIPRGGHNLRDLNPELFALRSLAQ